MSAGDEPTGGDAQRGEAIRGGPPSNASGEKEPLLARLRALLEEAIALGDADLLRTMRGLVAEAGDGVRTAPGEAWHGMIGTSPKMLALRGPLERYAQVSAPVLIRGESGTGKDLIARILHQLGPRRGEAMVSENCAAIPETLLESVLFGHKRGAFTGAVRDHPGHFVAAHRGTLFLDEIGDMPLSMQSKILRVLQEGEVRPVGGEKVRKVDVRVVAATHRDLEKMVRERSFREDLFFRLNVLRIDLPPLRERGGDVLLLARAILRQAAVDRGRELRIGPAAAAALEAYAWPGNIRQLQNELMRVCALADGDEITLEDLSPTIRAVDRPPSRG